MIVPMPSPVAPLMVQVVHEIVRMMVLEACRGRRWSRGFRALLPTIGAVGLLAACATPQHMRSAGDLIAPEQWFEEQTQWRMQGRVALSDGESGGQLSMGWLQTDELTSIDLRSGLGGRWWRLSFNENGARLEGSEQQIWSAAEPETLVHEATGWPMPITAFGDWIKGLPSPRDQALEFDDSGRLVGLEYEGWLVELGGYEASWGSRGQAVVLPSRFEFRKEPHRVRVVLNRWEWLKSGPGE